MDLESVGIRNLVQFLLVFIRTLGIFTLTPIFGQNQTPPQIRVGIALAMTLVFLPFAQAAAPLPTEMLQIAALALREVVVGLTIGFVVSVVFSAIHLAGDLVDNHAGFTFASIVDPVYGSQTALAGRLHQMLAAVLFFVTNSHHIMIIGLSDSFRIAPIGVFGLNPAVGGAMVTLFATMLVIAIRIAIPVVAAVALADVALAIASRVVPQMNVIMVGLPLKLGIGLVGMVIALPLLASSSLGLFGDLPMHIAGIARLAAK